MHIYSYVVWPVQQNVYQQSIFQIILHPHDIVAKSDIVSSHLAGAIIWFKDKCYIQIGVN